MLENVLLIFSHSYVHQGTIFDCDESAFDLSMNLNVKAMFLVTKEFVPEVSALCNIILILVNQVLQEKTLGIHIMLSIHFHRLGYVLTTGTVIFLSS